jgi:hypothetical protein
LDDAKSLGLNCPRRGGEPVGPRESRDSPAPPQPPAAAAAVVSPPPSTRRLDGIVDDRFTAFFCDDAIQQ